MGRIYNNNVGSFAGAWDIQILKPLDTRSIVQTKADLTTLATWKSSDGRYYHYLGMPVSVIETGDLYIYIGASGSTTDVINKNKWKLSSGSNGVAVFTLADIDAKDELPDEYINIGNPSLTGSPSSRTINVKQDGNYLNILFSAIRELLSEVARLKNSFYYGLRSYNEGNTTSSYIASSEEEEQEPLWAIDPEDLSEIESAELTIDSHCKLTPRANWIWVNDSPFISIGDEVETSTIQNYDELDTDAKVLFYSIIEPKQGFTFHINLHDNRVIKLEELGIPKLKCNIMFVCSRRIESEDTYYNKNFYWINVTDESGGTILLSYFTDNLLLTLTELNVDSLEMFKTISMSNLDLYKFNVYTKLSSFSTSPDIIPTRPDTDDFIFLAAHITIRSVSTYALLQLVKDRLLENELVWCKEDAYKGLYIKSDYEITKVGSTGSSTPMVYAAFTNTNKTIVVGNTLALTLSTNSTGAVTYNSSNSAVATVSSSGVVTAIKAGTTTITANIAADSLFGATSCTILLTIQALSGGNTGGDDTPDNPGGDTPATIGWKFGLTFPIKFGASNEAFITFPYTF